MPYLEDVLTSDSVKNLYESFRTGLLVVDKPENTYPSIRQGEMDAAEPIARWVHQRLLASANYQPREAPRAGFPYRATRPVTSILREGKAPWEDRPMTGTNNIYSRLSHDVVRLLVGNGLAIKSPPPRGQLRRGNRAYLWLAQWPDGRGLNWVGQREARAVKPDWREEKRIEEHRTTVVTRHHDLHIFKPPKADPKSIIEWANSFVPAALAVQDDLDAAKKRVAELEAKVSELESQAETSEWEGAAEALAAAFRGTTHPTEAGETSGEGG